MTPEQVKRGLALHINGLEASIKRAEKFAAALSQHYFGDDRLGCLNVYEVRDELRDLQKQYEADPGKAKFHACVFTLKAVGRI